MKFDAINITIEDEENLIEIEYLRNKIVYLNKKIEEQKKEIERLKKLLKLYIK